MEKIFCGYFFNVRQVFPNIFSKTRGEALRINPQCLTSCFLLALSVNTHYTRIYVIYLQTKEKKAKKNTRILGADEEFLGEECATAPSQKRPCPPCGVSIVYAHRAKQHNTATFGHRHLGHEYHLNLISAIARCIQGETLQKSIWKGLALDGGY
ncbi:MAG: hypothetical protein A3D65_05465 [Candidatus Lloydbacteria bacterium RIFCSPHIGHO2_02_FULL_50_13]|uniref:Uncharacterized protein n=1 Tax=Candidatus Lloydbacteria bacterium RIFCSPHIGHO2_02_FULL_50_13 TaxID=1798661 RepID=A0A1G2D7X8_9BACT|nr:MAG: hypothetical protein A3D65_05465 [Candidatus Lloydbacteria bacterium RIFCSPHIGHO2_02_FULL_50_13]